ncbi:hypothetical protein ANN_22841 [Periplaneta americana]|uniref:Transposase n=1 Tax=Periplaneta americana TaxID=6978 RepID=A0ABQ8SJF8_PERAM|nr:hypothetical protein ANN_22841 [Periplaneta americana]
MAAHQRRVSSVVAGPKLLGSAAVVERVRNLVMADRRLTMREIAEEVGDLLDTANTDPGFLNTVITGDESWVFGYDPGTKRQSSQWKHPESPRPKKARQVRSKIKVMLTVFFDVRGIVHHEYAPEGQMVTKEYYHDVLRRLRDAVRRKRPDMWTANNWHLHHDNAPAHSSQLIHTFLAKHGITTVHQPPYSPDLAPCDFWLFPKLKTPLKGSHFESREEIMRNATTELNTIPKEDFQRCFRQWKDRKDMKRFKKTARTYHCHPLLQHHFHHSLLHNHFDYRRIVYYDSLKYCSLKFGHACSFMMAYLAELNNFKAHSTYQIEYQINRVAITSPHSSAKVKKHGALPNDINDLYGIFRGYLHVFWDSVILISNRNHYTFSHISSIMDSLKKLQVSMEGTIQTLKLEKSQFTSQLDEQKQEIQQLRQDLEQRCWQSKLPSKFFEKSWYSPSSTYEQAEYLNVN